ncbi:hypothetical protein RRG08_036578 [Elysia crispata]|uniref:Uncharacterized protein n=1 Tax=Elysia crispata TaxID=231223 RepID=A0AAE0ZQT3_9GAST|nr:hypothetical protein RRG08_036578 [Elysia crispata]
MFVQSSFLSPSPPGGRVCVQATRNVPVCASPGKHPQLSDQRQDISPHPTACCTDASKDLILMFRRNPSCHST